jgi:hypothetical protein
MFANTFYYCYKGHVTNNNLLDINTKSLSFNLLELNKNKVKKVIAYS